MIAADCTVADIGRRVLDLLDLDDRRALPDTDLRAITNQAAVAG